MMTVPVAEEPLAHASPRRRPRISVAAALGAGILFIWAVIAIFGPWIAPFGGADFVSDESFDPASREFLLGTDYIGRDLLSRLLNGAGLTLGMGLAATLISHLIGVSLGFLAAIRGGLVDTVMSRLNDALLSIPTIMMGLVVIAALGSSIQVLVVTSGVVYASAVFRIARALAMDLKVMDFVEVARARGEGTIWILRYEILPNAWLPLLTDFAIRLSFIILFISALSFLGLGVQPPAADWGSMVRENIEGLRSGALAPIIPAAAIASVTVSLNLLVDELSIRSSRRAEGDRR
jgi:peptide/nickel transport system permease protein